MSAIALFESGLYPLYGYCPIIWLMIAVYPLYPTKNIHSKPIFIGIPSRSWGTTQVAHWCIPISLLDTPWIDDDTFLLSTIHWYPQFYCLYRHWWVNLPSSWLLPLISPHIVQNLCWLLVTLGLYYHILSSILKKKHHPWPGNPGLQRPAGRRSRQNVSDAEGGSEVERTWKELVTT